MRDDIGLPVVFWVCRRAVQLARAAGVRDRVTSTVMWMAGIGY